MLGKRRSRKVERVVFAAIAIAAFGCSNKNEDVSTNLDSGTAQQQALGAVEVVNGMVASVDEVAAGNFTSLGATIRRVHSLPEPRSSAEPVYDEGEGRWEYLETYDGPEGSFAYAFTIRFEDASGDAMMEPDPATASVAFGLTFDLAAESLENGDDVAVDLHYLTGLDVTNLQTDLYDVVGAGTLAGSFTGTKDGQNVDYDLTMSWGVDLDVPADGDCASGAVSIALDPYALTAAYDADSQLYAWTFSRGGATISSGTGTAACAQATAARRPLRDVLFTSSTFARPANW